MKKRPFLGTDLKLKYLSTPGMYEDADLMTIRRLGEMFPQLIGNNNLEDQLNATDLQSITDVDNIIQSLINRIQTLKGALIPLGHPEYGSRHHELIGELNTATNRNLVKLHILEALSHEPRIEKVVSSEVKTSPADQTRIDVTLKIKIIEIPDPINFVIPFSFEGRL